MKDSETLTASECEPAISTQRGEQGAWRDPSTAPTDGSIILVDTGKGRALCTFERRWSWKRFRSEGFFATLWTDFSEPENAGGEIFGWFPLPASEAHGKRPSTEERKTGTEPLVQDAAIKEAEAG